LYIARNSEDETTFVLKANDKDFTLKIYRAKISPDKLDPNDFLILTIVTLQAVSYKL
jgi:Ser/Thr protein kinase RdoA (MazF antagonist)